MHHRSKNTLIALLGLVWLPAGDEFDSGLRAYREGDFRAALAAFSAAEEAAGEDAAAELSYNTALAALRCGELLTAESAAEKAAARDAEAFAARRDFLMGNTAFARCEMAATQAGTPGAPPFAWDAALALARSARESWQRAAASRPDWPAARRNVERALLRTAELERAKAAAAKAEARRGTPKPRPRLIPLNIPQEPGSGPRPQEEPGQLSTERLKLLLETLELKEKHKLELRRARRAARGREVERDW